MELFRLILSTPFFLVGCAGAWVYLKIATDKQVAYLLSRLTSPVKKVMPHRTRSGRNPSNK